MGRLDVRKDFRSLFASSSFGPIPPILRYLPGPATFDFYCDGPAQKRSHDNQQAEGQYFFHGWLDGHGTDDVRGDQKFQTQLQTHSNKDFYAVIGIRLFLSIVAESTEA